MAWPYGGDWRGLTLQELPVVVAALCRAVNERFENSGGAAMEWEIRDGESIGEYPDAGDFSGLAGHEYGFIAGQLEFVIEWGNWYTAEGVMITGAAATAAVEAVAASEEWLGGVVTELERWQQASFWMTLRAYLDQYYIYQHVDARVDLEAASAKVADEGAVPGVYSSANDAYGVALADTPSAGSYSLGWSASDRTQVRLSPAATVVLAGANIGLDADVLIASPPTPGDFIKCLVRFWCSGFSQDGTNFEVFDETGVITQSDAWIADSGAEGGYVSNDEQEITLEGPTTPGTYEITMDYPSTVDVAERYAIARGSDFPTVLITTQIRSAFAGVNAYSVYMYIDIASELTDKD